MNNTGSPSNNLFLFGAGFTKAVFPEAPLNKDLLPVICNGSTSTTLKRYYKEHKTNDIEILLTRLDLEMASPKAKRQTALQTVRRAIEQQLAKYFEQFRFKESVSKENNWLESFVKLFNKNDAVITLNYDCLLDGLLDYHKVWCPSTGYGAVEVNVPGTSLQNLANPKNILIYKIHGSENFQTCSVDLKDVNPKRISLVVNEEIYPQSGKNRHLGVVQGEAYIIAPSFVKTFYPQIQLMMIGALQAAAMAKNFVIIGCGLRAEDSFLWLLLTAFLYRPANGELIIVDPCAKGIKDKICEHYHDTNKLISPICRNLECSVDELIEKLHNTCS